MTNRFFCNSIKDAMNFGRSFWIKLGTGLLILFVIILIVQALKKNQSNTYPFYSVPTPVPGAKSYTDPKTNFKMYYPADWKIISDSSNSDVLTIFSFQENNTDYFMKISHSSSENETYGQQFDKTDTQNVEYGGRKFQRVTYWQNGKPARIAVIDNDWSQQGVYNFVINLPPTNTEKYIASFDEIIQNLQFPSAPTLSSQP